MPINIDTSLPAAKILEKENIFLMSEERAITQDIRPLKILILNLMPTKIETETQLLRLLSNTPLQIDVELLQTATHTATHISQQHLFKFYKVFDDIKNQRFDGMIITGAPVEHLPFEKVDYWEELCTIMEWAKTHVFSTFHICWGAQAGLYYKYGIQKHPLPQKCFGVFEHQVLVPTHPLLRGFDEFFLAPHSRHTEILTQDVAKIKDLQILSISKQAGVYIIADKLGRNVYITGHSEYGRKTLAKEYFRDKEKGLAIAKPYHYFPNDDDTKLPIFTWRSHAHLLYSNWLNYFVYQQTPFDLQQL